MPKKNTVLVASFRDEKVIEKCCLSQKSNLILSQ